MVNLPFTHNPPGLYTRFHSLSRYYTSIKFDFHIVRKDGFFIFKFMGTRRPPPHYNDMATMIYEQVGRGNKWECSQLWGILLPQCLLTSRTNHDGRWISSHIFFNAVNHGMADADSVQPDPHHTTP